MPKVREKRDLCETFLSIILKVAVSRERMTTITTVRVPEAIGNWSKCTERERTLSIVPSRKTTESSACSARSSLSFRGAPKL